MTNNKSILQPIDRISIMLIIIFTVMIAILIGGGKICNSEKLNCPSFLHTGPRVRDFSWKNQQLGAEDTAFILTFDRPMDQESVEANLRIQPPLRGKISWAGRRLAYTLDTPVPYGETYKISLEGAREQFSREGDFGQVIQPFESQFNSRDRAFAYIGVQGKEQGRLVFYNWTKKQTTILTPGNLIVTDFRFYPQGDRLVFAAVEQANQGPQESKIYTVTTGLDPEQPAQIIQKILDNQDYQNLKLDISQDGKTIVLQRLNRKNPSDFGLWILQDQQEPQSLNNKPGGDFLIAPDSQTIAVAQGEGIAILPLKINAEPLDFLTKFGRVVTFSRNGKAAAMVNFNTDNANLHYIKSLFFVNNQGIEKKLFDIDGSIIDCKFDPTVTKLYCLLTKLLNTSEYIEKPYFAQIDLKTNQVFPLVELPQYQDIKLSMSSDGFGLLFEQAITSETAQVPEALRTNSGEAIVDSRLWLLLIPPVESSQPPVLKLEELPFVGIRPQWLP